MKPETRFQNKFLKAIRFLFPNAWIRKMSHKSISGIPDILICLNGRFVGVELKAHKSSIISKLQNYELDKITDAGGWSTLCYPENMDDVIKQLERINEKPF